MPTASDTELQSRFRELLSRYSGASELMGIVMDEMAKKFMENPNKTLFDAEREYKKRLWKTMDDLGKPEAPISLFYQPHHHGISSEEILFNQLVLMKEMNPEGYAKVLAKVNLAPDSPMSDVVSAVRIRANKEE